jgi:predicted acyltransferase
MTNNNEAVISPVVKKEPQRAYSIDALRGLSILLMVLSANIPFGVLPSWMYHAQEPPPSHMFNPNLPGVTWVDIIFPFFLFTMGSAIPLALAKKVKQNVPMWKLALSLLKRGFLLAGFAIYIYHINTLSNGGEPDWKIWCLRLLGFALLFPMLARLPEGWSKAKIYAARITGATAACVILLFAQFQDINGFSVHNSDIIILVLSNVSFFGGLIWLVSRENLLLRLSFLGILIAMRLSAPLQDWIQNLWNISPVPWLFQVQYLQYLFVVIPGTIIGDMALKLMNSGQDATTEKPYNKVSLSLIAGIMITITISVLIGLKSRAGFLTLLIVLALSGISWLLIKKQFAKDDFIYKLFGWGFYWLILGFFFEPYEGGIKKDHPTLSYYFVMSGLAIFVLIAFQILIGLLKRKKLFGLLIESGQNPLIAYAATNNLLYPLLILLYINPVLDSLAFTPWLGVLKGILITYLTALIARTFTKYKIFLRT